MARKIKNPEKYIERLKGDIRRLKGDLSDVHGRLARQANKSNPYKGECKATWEKGLIDEQKAFNVFALGEFNPGDMVVVTGIITETSKARNGSKLKFERKQTKLVQAIE